VSRPLSLNFWLAISIVVLAMLLRTASAQEKIAPQARVGEPWALSVSPDGRKVAAARGFQDAGGALMVWDLVDGKQTVVAEHKRGLLGAAFSPDGRRLAAGGFEGVLRIYDAASGKLLHQFTGNKAPINGVVWSPNGKLVATAGLDTTVRLWDLDDDRELHTFRGHPEWVLAVAYSPDGKWIVSACKDGTLKVWDVEGKKERLTLKGHGQGVQSVAVSPDGKWIASGAWGKDVRI
jgi:WD40 repeat protein